MFIIRAAFWLSIVLLLIPGDPATGGKSASAGAVDAVLAARAVVADLSSICSRQPDVCEHGGAALQAVGARAWQGAATLVSRFDGSASPEPATAAPATLGTLTSDDASPAWQPPVKATGHPPKPLAKGAGNA
ncbi:hypothetical protein SAMN02745157_0591 [Kaistia soli DSM 19436]|uniref:DUF5330 domain-containing protein n=1 Tax=Kaistia soli DSM 19436 TaxID=1122133 RepID=A0A1M4V2D2_9HYPH|nr:DUF5330 domain-containing protein [Kaistia soli]SHE63047.1 hypothetical protein SAMN02745157_0591 [Kaistia soli DSM 19436]